MFGSLGACTVLAACAVNPPAPRATVGEYGAGPGPVSVAGSAAGPLIIGESFILESGIMGEARRINVLVPTVYGAKIDAPMPVLYVLDGGIHEDFLHIAGLVQVLVSGGSMRPFIVVGIENTQRRRDMTGPTASPEDRKIAPTVGGSATFRRFIREELMPAVRTRHRTTEESAVIGESLAGLFVVETFLLEPATFGVYIAVDPSLWWAEEALVKTADSRAGAAQAGRPLFLASSNEPTIARLTGRLAEKLGSRRDLVWHHAPMATESHGTVFHPAAMLAMRTVLAPPKPAS